MNEIKCPKCGTVITISEEDYSKILSQVRNTEFDKEISIRESTWQKELQNQIKLTENTLESKYEKILNENKLTIQSLQNEIKNNTKNTELAIKDAILEQEKNVLTLKSQLDNEKSEHLLKEQTLKDTYEEKIKYKDEQIAYYKDFKAKQSTKMIGESLEVHCNTEFNRIRPMFNKNTYFEKDNDAKTGSKGDFIFRDYDEDNTEIISIMFEMKNESDTTSTKHKNEDFLKELNKDRQEKNCEYAVLVSLLEKDNDIYNDGIVDVSHLYDKMYVIRPQFFIPIITLLRNAALNSLKYKKQLQIAENTNIDISNFESNINNFKEGFNRNYRLASEKFAKAIEEIDKTIEHLEKTKEALLSSDKQLRLANNKAEELTIKKITANNPTMQKLFKDLEDKKEDNYE